MKQYIKVLRQYADFKGRASREEFWMFILFNMLVTFAVAATGTILSVLTGNAGVIYLPCLYLFAVLIPGWAVLIRRLHDTGRSAWFLLVSLIPLFGAIWLLIVLIQKSEEDDNRYGKNPLTAPYTRYHRIRSAAVALIIASVFWLLQSVLLFIFWHDTSELIFPMLISTGLIITGAILFSKRMFAMPVALAIILVSVVWLTWDVYFMLGVFTDLSTSFNFTLIIYLLTVLIPVALLLTGLYIILKYTDYTVPACLLFVGSSIWILYMILNLTQGHIGIYDIPVFLLIKVMTIVVPVSLMVFARTLLSQNVTNRKSNVVYIREDKDNNNIWVIYKAPSKTDAMSFLSKQTITQPCYYVVVETPEGNFGRDKDGFYQE